MSHKRKPEKAAIFRDFADGLDMPPAARRALGLTPDRPATVGGGLVPAMREPLDDKGLAYPDTPDDAAENVTNLWEADLADTTELVRGRVDPGRWNDASLRWLVTRHACLTSPRTACISVCRTSRASAPQ